LAQNTDRLALRRALLLAVTARLFGVERRGQDDDRNQKDGADQPPAID
jgi:hypothetical protein